MDEKDNDSDAEAELRTFFEEQDGDEECAKDDARTMAEVFRAEGEDRCVEQILAWLEKCYLTMDANAVFAIRAGIQERKYRV